MAGPEKVITIDGPAGAGKSTLARAAARELGWTYLDTGAMYRAVGLAAHEAGLEVGDEKAMASLTESLGLRIVADSDENRVFLNQREITAEIRKPIISELASAASALAVVREAMVDLQRKIAAPGRFVAEGRDMGTVVFPGAFVKFFLDASLEKRAERRYLELLDRGEKVDPQRVKSDMEKRDQADSSRALSPLKPAPDAIMIDSTSLAPEEVLKAIVRIVREKLSGFGK